MRTIAVATLPLWLALIDATVMNVAFDHLSGALGATLDEIAWASTSYTLAGIAILPLNGWLVSRFGRSTVFRGVLLLFAGGSALCGFSTTAAQLAAFRFLQGVGGGLLATTGQSILIDAYPDDHRADAMQILSVSAVVAPLLGPIVGGALIDTLGWRAIFFVNLPIAVYTIALASRCDIDARESVVQARFSPTALALLLALVVPLQFVLQSGDRLGWLDDGVIRLSVIVVALSAPCLVVSQLRAARPMIDFRCFANKEFAVGSFLTTIACASNYAVAFVGPLFLQHELQFSAYQAGLMIVPAAIAMFFGNRFADALERRGWRPFAIIIGMVIFGVAQLYIAAFGIDNTFDTIEVGRAMQGLGIGMFFVPIGIYTMSTISRDKIDAAGGLIGLVRQVSGMVGIAAVASILSSSRAAYLRVYADAVPSISSRQDAVTWGARFNGMSRAADALAYGSSFKALYGAATGGAMLLFAVFLVTRCFRRAARRTQDSTTPEPVP